MNDLEQKSVLSIVADANREANYYDSLRTAECLGDKPTFKKGLAKKLDEALDRLFSEKPEIKWNDRVEDLEGA